MTKWSIEKINEWIYMNAYGYKLISTEYKNIKEKLLFECPEGHIFESIWDNFLRGHRCPKCATLNKAKAESFSEEYVRNYFLTYGYILLSEYVNSVTKVKVQCPEGHIYDVTFHMFKNGGTRCPYCANVIISYDEIKNYIESEGYVLLSKTYINAKTKLKLQCPHNHIFEINWNNFKSGKRCPECSNENHSGENHYNWQGGITPLHKYMREKINIWKKHILFNNNYRCIITNEKKNLVVHHIISFNTILKMALKELSIPLYANVSLYTQNQLDKIEEYIISKHTETIGITLVNTIHNLFHQEYGKGDNNFQQFNDFITRLKTGEFNKFLKENNLIINLPE